MLKLRPIYLSLIAGFIMVIAWPPLPTAFLLFIGLVPLFFIHKQLEITRRQHLKFWAYTYLALLIFNTGSTWWVWNASPTGCIMMLLMNSLLMSLPFVGYSLVKQVYPKWAFVAFVVFYLGFEFWHFNWNASWPWLTLGKGFASVPFFIQWYEYTGEMGGSLLVLVVNSWIAALLLNNRFRRLWQPVVLVMLFAVLSVSRKSYILNRSAAEKPRWRDLECVISQPNIDPYTEKFNDGEMYLYPEIQLDYAIAAAEPYMTEKTDVLLFPETAIVGYNDESELNRLELFRPLLELTEGNSLCILAGAETYSTFKEKNRPTLTARFDSLSGLWYDSYNTALLVKNKEVAEIYHKSKLVPGVEKMPFAFLEKLSINLGGTSGSLGTNKEAANFTVGDNVKISPLICYESVFGDYTNEFIKKGANILAVVTNDGWWGETPGYAQHLLYGTIRCIETRREMIRSANTGVSAKIDRFGRIEQSLAYKKRGAFACKARPYSGETFYVRYGNLIGLCSAAGSLILLIVLLVKALRMRKSKTAGN